MLLFLLTLMNFLAHDAMLSPTEPPLTRVGSAVPDLWRFLPRRPLPFLLLPELEGATDDGPRDLARGIRSHLQADATFHGHPEFVRRMRWLKPLLAQAWPALGDPYLGAHVLVEMILDRWLLEDDASRLERYFDCFTPTNLETAARHGASDDVSREALHRVLERFVELRPMADYPRACGLAMRFGRVMERVRLGCKEPPPTTLAERIDEWSADLAGGSENLLADVRAAIAPGP